jgi:head-tail adaptor
MTSAGDLKYRLTLEVPVEAPDGAGGVTRGYAAVATVWTSLEATAGRADIVAESVGAVITHRIIMRTGPEVTTRHRFRLGARIFRIVAVREQEDGRFLAIHAEERTD